MSWAEQFLQQTDSLRQARAATTGERKVFNYLNNDFSGIIKKSGLDFNHYSRIHSFEFIEAMAALLTEFNFFASFNKNAAKEKLIEMVEQFGKRQDLTYAEHCQDHNRYHITFYTWLEPLESLSTALSIKLKTLGK